MFGMFERVLNENGHLLKGEIFRSGIVRDGLRLSNLTVKTHRSSVGTSCFWVSHAPSRVGNYVGIGRLRSFGMLALKEKLVDSSIHCLATPAAFSGLSWKVLFKVVPLS
jgi:hypothetical protein